MRSRGEFLFRTGLLRYLLLVVSLAFRLGALDVDKYCLNLFVTYDCPESWHVKEQLVGCPKDLSVLRQFFAMPATSFGTLLLNIAT